MLAQRVLDAGPMQPTPTRRRASRRLWLGVGLGDLEQAVSLDEEALDIYKQLADPVRSANALVFLGTLYQAVGRSDGRETLERGLARLQEAGDEYGATPPWATSATSRSRTVSSPLGPPQRAGCGSSP